MERILRCHEIKEVSFVRGEDCYLYDHRGRRYVDFESGIWCTVLGHCHPRINQVIRSQSEKLMHLGTRYLSPFADAAASSLLDVLEIRDGACAFLSSGSEAVELAVQAARRITGKQLLLTFSDAYLAAYGSAGRKSSDEWWLLDWCAAERDGSRAWLREIPFHRIGGFVLEPGGSGSAFVRFPPREIVRQIAGRVKESGGLLVVDEVTTGMGRTGEWFGFQHYGIRPDIVALGKGLGNGYPISAVAMKRSAAEELEASGFHHAQSHQNDPLGCAVANEVIATLHEGNWIDRGHIVGAFFLKELRRLADEHEVAREARGRGMLLGLELAARQRLSVRAIYEQLLERGFLVGYYAAGNILRFDPALTIDTGDITLLVECLDQLLSGSLPAIF